MRAIGVVVLLAAFCMGLPAYAQKSGQDRVGVQPAPPAAPPKEKLPDKERPAFTRAPGQFFNIDLDTMDNHFSQWVQKDVSSLSAMKASLKIARADFGNKYEPYFTVRVQGEDGSFGGLRIKVNPANTKELMAEAYVRNKDAKSDTTVTGYSTVVAVDKPLDVMLAWKDGTVTAWLFAEAAELKIPGKVTEVHISSSTGEIMGDVELGQ
jgi:hypothetical protein